MDWIKWEEGRISMNEHLDERKLNSIKVKIIELEKDNIIRRKTNDAMVETIRKYIEKVVDGR